MRAEVTVGVVGHPVPRLGLGIGAPTETGSHSVVDRARIGDQVELEAQWFPALAGGEAAIRPPERHQEANPNHVVFGDLVSGAIAAGLLAVLLARIPQFGGDRQGCLVLAGREAAGHDLALEVPPAPKLAGLERLDVELDLTGGQAGPGNQRDQHAEQHRPMSIRHRHTLQLVGHSASTLRTATLGSHASVWYGLPRQTK